MTPKGTAASPRSSASTNAGKGPDRKNPQASSRYTPPQPAVRLRPRWHRPLGWLGVAIGLLVVVLNDGMLMTNHVQLLPGGHSELYLLVGIGLAAASTWFLGLFDRGVTVYA